MASLFTDPQEKTYWGYLKLQFKAAHAVNRRSLTGVVFLTLCLFVGLIFLLAQARSTFFNKTSSEPIITAIAPSPQTPAHPAVLGDSHVQPTPQPVVYQLRIQSKPVPTGSPPTLIADLLITTLNLPMTVGRPLPLSAIAYDTSYFPDIQSLDRRRFDQTYYVVTETPGAISQAYYESTQLRVTAVPADPSLLPYILDHRFCQTDQDCQLRRSYCAYGAYNRYEPLIDVFTCLTNSPTSSFSASLQCEAIDQLVRPSCQNNQCQAETEPVCISN